MNYFEQELRSLFGNDSAISDKRFVGRAFFGKLSNHYQPQRGPVDAVTLRFSDLLGRKTVCNQNFRDGITPYIWKYGDKIEWYVYKPIKADYDQISESLNDYFDVFREPSQEMEQSGQSENGLTTWGQTCCS